MTITLVTGPPCAGKTTYVEQHGALGDRVVDFDHIAQHLGSPRTHNHHAAYAQGAGQAVDLLYARIRAGLITNAWVINTAPSAPKRQLLADDLGANRILIVLADPDVLHQRAEHRPNPAATHRLIDWWLNAYTLDDDPRTEVIQ